MSQGAGVNQKELKILLASMKKFPVRVQKQVMNGTARAATVVVKKEMVYRVPYEYGTLEGAISIKKLKHPKQNETAYTSYIKKLVVANGKLGKLKNTKQYAYYLEYGTEHSRSMPFIRPSLYAVGERPLFEARRYFFANIEKKATSLGLSRKGSRELIF